MIRKIVGLYYRPLSGTKQMTEMISRELAGILDECIPEDVVFECLDLGDENVSKIVLDSEEDIVVIGVPVYVGKIPLPAAEALERIKGDKVMTLVTVSYGGRSCGNALYELKRCAEEAGLKVIGAGAFMTGRRSGKGSERKAGVIDAAAIDEFETAVSAKIKRLTGCEVEGLRIKPAPVETPGRMPVHLVSRVSPKAAAAAQALMERLCIMRRRSEWYL